MLDNSVDLILPGVGHSVSASLLDFQKFCGEWIEWVDAGAYKHDIMTSEEGLCNTFLTWLLFKHTSIVEYDYDSHTAFFIGEDGERLHELDYTDTANVEMYDAQEEIYTLMGIIFEYYGLNAHTPFNNGLVAYQQECKEFAIHKNVDRINWVRRFLKMV